MIRHPLVLLVQALCAAALFLEGPLALLAHHRLQRAPLEFALTVLGQVETEEGGWKGVDLLRDPERGAQRVQLTVTPHRAVRVRLEALDEDGVRTLFPLTGQAPVLAKGRSYSLPGPTAFYGVEGAAHLRLILTPAEEGRARPSPARKLGGEQVVRYPLSDGSRYRVTQQRFRAGGPAEITLKLNAP